jgi:hypothetical protein
VIILYDLILIYCLSYVCLYWKISHPLFVRRCLYIGNVQVMKIDDLVAVRSSRWFVALIRSTRGDKRVFSCRLNYVHVAEFYVVFHLKTCIL